MNETAHYIIQFFAQLDQGSINISESSLRDDAIIYLVFNIWDNM